MARVRSPNYPVIGLPTAIERVGKIHKVEQTLKAAPDVVAKALGYTGLNGASLSVISALKKYGLLEEVGKDLKVSKDALTILLDPKDSVERAKAIHKAAFTPALFAQLQKHYGDAMPSDENLRSYLLKREFAMSTVDVPIRAYRETHALVEEANAIYNPSAPDAERPPAERKDELPEVEVGDLVQWEAGGTLKLESARRVRAISEHDGAFWVFVEGSETGIPMEEVLLEQKGGGKRVIPPTLPLPLTDEAQVKASEREWLRGPLSRDVSYRLIVSGDIGPTEIGKLMKLLKAQQEVLTDDPPSEPGKTGSGSA